MHTAVIKLDALADAVRAAAYNHDLLFPGRQDFILIAVARVIIRRESLKFSRAGIDQAEGGVDAGLFTQGAHRIEIDL